MRDRELASTRLWLSLALFRNSCSCLCSRFCSLFPVPRSFPTTFPFILVPHLFFLLFSFVISVYEKKRLHMLYNLNRSHRILLQILQISQICFLFLGFKFIRFLLSLAAQVSSKSSYKFQFKIFPISMYFQLFKCKNSTVSEVIKELVIIFLTLLH